MLNGVGDPLEIHEVDEPRMREAIETVAEFAKQHCRQEARCS